MWPVPRVDENSTRMAGPSAAQARGSIALAPLPDRTFGAASTTMRSAMRDHRFSPRSQCHEQGPGRKEERQEATYPDPARKEGSQADQEGRQIGRRIQPMR